MLATEPNTGPQGAFVVKSRKSGADLCIIAADARDWPDEQLGRPRWEHVSVHVDGRCPTWEEMEEVRDWFWVENETVVQFSVPRKDHINVHPHTLHMWRVIEGEFPRPPDLAV
jgi:hypothetical protein